MVNSWNLNFYIHHGRPFFILPEGAERKFLYKKTLRPLRLCGETNKNDRIL
jgi:hypothetical protein